MAKSGGGNKKVSAPKMGHKKTASKKASKKPQSKKAGRKGRTPSTSVQRGNAYVCKMGEGQVPCEVTEGETVLDLLTRAEFPPGTFKTHQGGDIRNLIDAANQEVTSGRQANIASCFQDLRVDAEPGTLETPIKPGSIVTLVPKITGG